MISFLIWLVGVVLCIKAIMEVVKMPITEVGKAICIILLVVGSWLALALYYFYAKDKITTWFK